MSKIGMDVDPFYPVEVRMGPIESAIFDLGQGRKVMVRQSGDRLIVTSNSRLLLEEMNSGKLIVGAAL